MKVKARLIEILPLQKGKYRYVIESDKTSEELDGLLSSEVDVEIKKHRERRSLDANAYTWLLLNKLSEKLNVPAVDIYRDMVKNVGGNNEVVCVQNKAVEKLVSGWQRNGIGWVADIFPSKIDGCTNVILYYGSSEYDVEQMTADRTRQAGMRPTRDRDRHPRPNSREVIIMAKSIIQKTDRCYVCGGSIPTDTHHVFEGSNRAQSDKYGLTIRVHRRCHEKLHNPTTESERDYAKALKRCVQTMAMNHYGWDTEEWLKHFTKNWRD